MFKCMKIGRIPQAEGPTKFKKGISFYLQHVLAIPLPDAFDVYPIGPVTVSILPIDCNDATVHDAMRITVVRTDRCLDIPMVHGSVVAVGSERNGETVEGNMVVESQTVATDDASTVWAHVIRHDRYDQLDRHGFRVQCGMCKRDCRLTDRYHCD